MAEDKIQPLVEVHQCLFGYKDGHQLISSSLHFPSETESTLLNISDLAPGVSDFDIKNYWTGIPLKTFGYYALLYTWPAPEMPRPGCVWTHALFIKLSDISKFTDLSILKDYITRPTKTTDYSSYSKTLLVNGGAQSNTSDINKADITSDSLIKVIRAVYRISKEPMVFADDNELDASIFRIWSQQWPKLRRQFAFRTIGSTTEKQLPEIQFNLHVFPQDAKYKLLKDDSLLEEICTWEKAACDDALSPTPTSFRRFMWRYGADINDGIERFNFLAGLYSKTQQCAFEKKDYENLLHEVANLFPDKEDGNALKKDLVEGIRNPYSLIPPTDPIASLRYFVNQPLSLGMPLPSDEFFSILDKLWPQRSDEILALAENAIRKESRFSRHILEPILTNVTATDFFPLTVGTPKLRYQLIKKKPALLDSDDLALLTFPELSKLLTLLPNKKPLVKRTIKRLLKLNNKKMAEKMYARFPDIVTKNVLDIIEKNPDAYNVSIEDVWIQVVFQSAELFLQGGYVENSKSLNSLAIYAKLLGFMSASVVSAGPLPWSIGLEKARGDISKEYRDQLSSFLLTLAIKRPVSGSEIIFEYTFDHIHSALADNNLTLETRNMIESSLLDKHWWQKWDLCLRLQITVVDAYICNRLDSGSFKRLTKNKVLFGHMIKLVRETRRGREFLKDQN